MKKQRKTFRKQQDRSDCGAACLASIVSYFGAEISLETARSLSGTSTQGTTMLGLHNAAKQLGFNVEAFQVENVADLKNLETPAILHVAINQNLLHFIIVYRIEKNKVLVGDPAKGVYYSTIEHVDEIWKSRALLKLTPSEQFKKELGSLKRARKAWLLSLINPGMDAAVTSASIGILLASLGLSTAIFSQKLVDQIIPEGSTNKLVLGVTLLGILFAVRIALGYTRGVITLKHTKQFNNNIIELFYSHLLHLPKSFFDSRRTGDMIARLNDTKKIQFAVTFLFGNFLIDLLVVILSIAAILFYSAFVCIVVLVNALVFILISSARTNRIRRAQRALMTSYANAESHYIDSIQGVFAIKSSNMEAGFQKKSMAINNQYQEDSYRLGILTMKITAHFEVVWMVSTLITLALSASLVLANRMMLGEMVAILSLSSGVIPSLMRLSSANNQFQEAKVAFDRMFEFVSIKPEKKSAQDKVDSLEFYQLTIENVSFGFPGRKKMFTNVSFKVRRGEITLLIGKSGCGKSTLFQLLQRFYKPNSGEITIDGTEIEHLDISFFRQNIGIVPQEIKIFNGSIIYNITLSEEKEAVENAKNLCNSLGINRSFEEFPQGYETLIGEEGLNLSGGQKQLVAIARALVRTPKILLLDEPTSGMDEEMESYVFALLDQIKKNAAIIMITHRITNTKRSDKTYVMENGAVTPLKTQNDSLKP